MIYRAITINTEPTPKKERMALILEAAKDRGCSYCYEESVRAMTVYDSENIVVHHLCETHKNMNIWTDNDTAWGWND